MFAWFGRLVTPRLMRYHIMPGRVLRDGEGNQIPWHLGGILLGCETTLAPEGRIYLLCAFQKGEDDDACDFFVTDAHGEKLQALLARHGIRGDLDACATVEIASGKIQRVKPLTELVEVEDVQTPRRGGEPAPDSQYPHKCPYCWAAAYVGLLRVDCSNEKCNSARPPNFEQELLKNGFL